MFEVILDTETTGLSTAENHRVVEIGCVELNNQIPTNKIFHEYLNPERSISSEAFKIHGYTDKFLSSKKTFSEIADNFLDFIQDKKIIIHNAPFDLSFLNYELRRAKKKEINKSNIIDTLELARQKYPGSQNSLDALCKRFNIDNSKREKHTALIDCHLLKEVYINLTDQKEPKLNLENSEIPKFKSHDVNTHSNKKLKKIVKIISFLKSKNLIFTILLTNSSNMKKLNKKFRKCNKSTDVLSFPSFSLRNLKLIKEKNFYIGDIAASYEIINFRSKKNNFFLEFDKIWIHGLLHLIGYNHTKNKDYFKMNRIEKRILNSI